MKKTVNLSVIIYHSATTYLLESTIESIIAGSVSVYEIIVVYRDDTALVTKTYEKYNGKIKIFFIQAPSSAGRLSCLLLGYKRSTGKYVAFCEAGDMVSFDYYRRLTQVADTTDAEIVAADVALYEHTENDYSLFNKVYSTAKYFNLDILYNSNLNLTGDEITELFMKTEGLCTSIYLISNKIYKRELFDSCYSEYDSFTNELGEINLFVDMAISHLLWIKSQKFINIHNVFHYRIVPDDFYIAENLNDFARVLCDINAIASFYRSNLKRYGIYEKYRNHYKNWIKLLLHKLDIIAGERGYRHLLHNDSIFYKASVSGEKNIFINDNYFQSITSPVGDEFERYETIKQKICSEDIEYVSFDIFDTLLVRPVLYPADIFHLMSNPVNKLLKSTHFVDFAQIRYEAEQECRKSFSLNSTKEDITLDDIYNFISKRFYIDEVQSQQIMNLEMEVEYKFLYERGIGKELYDLALDYGKRIICISDMYLSKQFINNVLINNGYKSIYELYVSSEYGMCKYSGNLYLFVLKDLGITCPQTIIHIGDNFDVDVRVASDLGLHTGYLPNARDCLLTNSIIRGLIENNPTTHNYAQGVFCFSGFRCMLGLIAMKLFDDRLLSFNDDSDINAQPYILGYMLLGMQLYAIADWLNNEIEITSTLHLMSRDGYLVKKAINIINPKRVSNYFYMSRKAMIGILVSEGSDIKSLSTFVNWKNICPWTLWESIKNIAKSQDKNVYIDFCRSIQFPIYKKFTYLSQFYLFIETLRENFLDRFKMRELIVATEHHLKSTFRNHDAIFDIGYSGRTEELLKSLANITIKSFYIYINNDNFIHRKSIYKFMNETFYQYTPQLFCQLREMLYSEPGQSCIAYDVQNGKIVHIFDDTIMESSSSICFSIIQDAALDFVCDFINIFGSLRFNIPYRHEDVSAPLEYFFHYAKDIDKLIFRTTTFEDDVADRNMIKLLDLWNKLQNEKYKSISLISFNNKNEIDSLQNEKAKLHEKFKLAQYKISQLEKIIKEQEFELDLRWITISVLKNKLSLCDNGALMITDSHNYKDIVRNTIICSPPDFDEVKYMADNSDVRNAIANGVFKSAFSHYMLHGRNEGRKRQ